MSTTPIRYSGDGFEAPLTVFDRTGTAVLDITAAGAVSLGKAGGTLGLLGATPAVEGTAYTQTYATAAKTVPTATQLTPPAGGTGATAGAYDTAANRDLMIDSITAGAADLLALKKVVNALIDDLQAAGIVA